MDTLILFRRGQEVRRLPIGSDAVEIGSAPECDIVVDEPAVAARALLVRATGGSVWLYALHEQRIRPRVLPYDGELPLGREHSLRRECCAKSPARARDTESNFELSVVTAWNLLVGLGPEARRLRVADLPVRVGSAPGNDLVLSDRTVSAQHCRLEPSGRDLVVRDLGSRNGTCVDGVYVERARVRAGARLQLGRSQLIVAGASLETAAQPTFVAESVAMQALLAEVDKLANVPWPTLLLGPSGSGKEELAARLHRASRRRRGPFVALNAGGLPPSLVESELFGYERGAFTGAVSEHRGVFEQADHGTLFLDEIGELPLSLQARLLRVLEGWKVRRVGAEGDRKVNVRLVCATHRDLVAMVRAGRFREDLFYRLNQLVIEVPGLQARPSDIVPLAEHFLAQVRAEVGFRELSPRARARLLSHHWPGNVRELRNVVRAAAVLSAAQTLELGDVERAMRRLSCDDGARAVRDPAGLRRVVADSGGNLAAAARALGVPRSTLRDRLRPRAPATPDEPRCP